MGFWAGTRVLVTGGTGFVGSHVADLLLSKGAVVTVTSRNPVSGARVIIGDLEEPSFAPIACEGQEIVLHLAGHVGGVDYNRIRHSRLFIRNMLPFLNILNAAHEARVHRLLVTSSACVYPRNAINPIPESEGIQNKPEDTNAGYGWAKRMQEYVGSEWMKETSIPVAIARPFNAYGPRDNFSPESSHVIPSLLRRVLAGEDPLVVWGSGEQTRTFLYVKDFAEGLLLLAEHHAVGEPVNLASEEVVSIRDLVGKILEVTGRSPEVVFDPALPEGQPRRSCDLTRMREVLKWEPQTPLLLGLKETYEWLKSTTA